MEGEMLQEAEEGEMLQEAEFAMQQEAKVLA